MCYSKKGKNMEDTDKRPMTKVFLQLMGAKKLGLISDEEVSDYLKELRSFKIPETRCCSGYGFILKTHNVSGAPYMYDKDMQGQQYLSITPVPAWKNAQCREQPLCGLFRDEFGDIPGEECFERIKRGECPDSFINKFIFEKFFQGNNQEK
jgi:hypothetical protein